MDRDAESGGRLDPQALVEPLRRDNIGGATALAAEAATLVTRAARSAVADSPDELRRALEDIALRILDAQPAMAPLVTLAREVLTALEGATTVAAARSAAQDAARAFRLEVERGVAGVARRAAPLLPPAKPVLTLSSSATVRATLVEASGRRIHSVICLESRPLREGRHLARALAAAEIGVLYAVDAALESLVPGAGVVLLGADAVGDKGVVNKIGSVAAARAAAAHGVPVIVVVDRSKLLPPGFPEQVTDDRPPEEVWAGREPDGSPDRAAGHRPPGVRAWNRYFETVDPSLVGLIVTQDGAFTPSELDAVRARLPLPPRLGEWARARAAAPREGPPRGTAPSAPG